MYLVFSRLQRVFFLVLDHLEVYYTLYQKKHFEVLESQIVSRKTHQGSRQLLLFQEAGWTLTHNGLDDHIFFNQTFNYQNIYSVVHKANNKIENQLTSQDGFILTLPRIGPSHRFFFAH